MRSGNHELSSDTDTEVLIHLIEEQEGSLKDQVRSAIAEVKGILQ